MTYRPTPEAVLASLFAWSYQRWLDAAPTAWPGAEEMWAEVRAVLAAAANPEPVDALQEALATIEAMSGDAADLHDLIAEAAAMRTVLGHLLNDRGRIHDSGCGTCDTGRALLTVDHELPSFSANAETTPDDGNRDYEAYLPTADTPRHSDGCTGGCGTNDWDNPPCPAADTLLALRTWIAEVRGKFGPELDDGFAAALVDLERRIGLGGLQAQSAALAAANPDVDRVLAALNRVFPWKVAREDAESVARELAAANPRPHAGEVFAQHEAMGCCDSKTLEHVWQSLETVLGSAHEQPYVAALSDALLRLGHHSMSKHQSPEQYDSESGLACAIPTCLAALSPAPTTEDEPHV